MGLLFKKRLYESVCKGHCAKGRNMWKAVTKLELSRPQIFEKYTKYKRSVNYDKVNVKFRLFKLVKNLK